jgi:hypothetical protein
MPTHCSLGSSFPALIPHHLYLDLRVCQSDGPHVITNLTCLQFAPCLFVLRTSLASPHPLATRYRITYQAQQIRQAPTRLKFARNSPPPNPPPRSHVKRGTHRVSSTLHAQHRPPLPRQKKKEYKTQNPKFLRTVAGTNQLFRIRSSISAVEP